MPLDVQVIEIKNKPENETLNTLKSAGITDARAKQFADVKRVYMDKMKELVADTSLSIQDKKKKIKELTIEKNGKYKQILGDQKYHAFNQVKKIAKESEVNN